MSQDDDFRPRASWKNLKLRAALLRRVRQFFDTRGFLEVDTPLLSADTVVDRHLDPLPVTLFDDPRRPTEGRTLWLQTSPEFGMKRLLAAGATAIVVGLITVPMYRAAQKMGAVRDPVWTLGRWGSPLMLAFALLSLVLMAVGSLVAT